MKLALGTAQFGLNYGVANTHGKIESAAAREILDMARINDIDTLDTAITYGDAESVLGSLVDNDWRIVTKLPAFSCTADRLEAKINSAVKSSLKKLHLDKLDGLLLHSPEQLLQPYGRHIFEILETLKEQGLVSKTGVSVYEPAELETLCRSYKFDLVQAPLNILDRRLEKTGWVHRLVEEGTELHVRSVFLQGLLLMPADLRPEGFRKWDELWGVWDKWLQKAGISPLAACLHYVKSVVGVEKIIVGVDSASQLKEILTAYNSAIAPIPEELYCNDPELLNPSRWESLCV